MRLLLLRDELKLSGALMRILANPKLTLGIMLFCFSMGVYYDSAVERNPRLVAVKLVWRGWYANALDRNREEALRYFSEAESLYPNYGWIYYCRADVLAEHGSLNQALKEYEKAIALGGDRQLRTKARLTRSFVSSSKFDRSKDFVQQVSAIWDQFPREH